ncbi:hypothetical protein BKA93DRAFT_824853 [Sparassis latifolia]
MAALLQSFNAALVRRPMLTQCATSAVLFGSGDVVAQQAFEQKGREHDFARTARLAFYGGAIFGPLLTKWLQLLNRISFASPIKGVVWMDQTMFTPAVIGIFFGSMTFLEGKGVAQAQERISDAYVPTLVRNWGVFVPAQALNFALVPPHLRFVAVGAVSLFWNSYLSAVNARNARLEAGGEGKAGV